MSKTVDVDLRIRAKNLSKSTLSDITKDVERLTDAQAEQAKSADLAARSMKELIVEQKNAAAIARELSGRKGLLDRYVQEREEIDKLAAKMMELTAARRKAAEAAGVGAKADKGLKEFDRQIVQTQRALDNLASRSDKTKNRLESLGVSTVDVGKSMAVISANIDKTSAAYDVATKNVTGYSAAVKRANDIQAEAVRRTNEEVAARQRAAQAARSAIQATGSRSAELNTLRKDIEERSAQARAIDVAAEAQRRLASVQKEEAAILARNNAQFRETVQLLEQRRQRQAALQDVFGKQLTLQEREQRAQEQANARRQRLIALIQSERGQRLLAVEAQRREAAVSTTTAAAKERLATATGRAAREQALFADTGRKSLSVYQRIRGQVLALASAYIGVYQTINTVQEAIAAVNRNQSLRIGLVTANEGDTAKAAADYKFLREEADRLGLVFDDVAPKYANMAIAAKGVGVSMKETRQLFTDVSTAVAAGNLSLDDSEGVFRAMVQIMGKARVQAEELRGQLGDRLPGAVAAFAKANNIAITDLDAMMKKGELGVEELIKFARGYAEQYAPVMAEATTRLQADMNRARNAYNDWLRTVLDSKNQTELKKAFKAIETFFNGEDGERFALALGKAFRTVVDVFLWLAENIDLVTKALKIFLTIQVTKFAIDAANGIRGLVVQVVALGTASKTAGTSMSGMALAASRLKIALTGIAGLVLGITAVLDAQTEALARVTKRTEDYIDLVETLGRQGGVAKSQTSSESAEKIKAVDAEIAKNDELIAKYKEVAEKSQTGFGRTKVAFGTMFGFSEEAKDLGLGTLTDAAKKSQEEINKLTQRNLFLREAQSDELEIQLDLMQKEARAEEETKKPPKPDPKDDPDASKKAEAAAAKALRERQARETAEDAAAKKILEIQDEIAQARVDKSAASDEAIEQNYASTLKRIDIDIQKKRLEIDALARQSEKAGVDNSERFATMDGLLIRLEAMRKERAEEEKVAAKVELREAEISRLMDERNAKIELQNTLAETGQQGILTTQQNVNALQDEYNAKINGLTTEFITFLTSLDPEGEMWKRLGLGKVLADMQQINAETVKLTDGQKVVAKWGETVANGLAEGFVALGAGIADSIRGFNDLSGAIKGAWDAFRTFAADFLVQIGQMILQAIILQAIQNAISGGSGGYMQAVKGVFGTGHTGGVVKGSGRIGTNPTKTVSPMVFAGAERFHEGGLPGLKRGEVPAILKEGEEVLNERDPRNVLNGGGASGPAAVAPIQNNIMFDTVEVFSAAMQRPDGQKAFLSTIKSNRASVRAVLGI